MPIALPKPRMVTLSFSIIFLSIPDILLIWCLYITFHLFCQAISFDDMSTQKHENCLKSALETAERSLILSEYLTPSKTDDLFNKLKLLAN